MKGKVYSLRVVMTVSIWSGPGKLSWCEAGTEPRVSGVGCGDTGRSNGAARGERVTSVESGPQGRQHADMCQYVIIMCDNKVTLFDAKKRYLSASRFTQI